jgi:antitoxin YefM
MLMYIKIYMYIMKEVTPMKAISYTAARENLAKTMKKVCEDHDPIIIIRRNNDAVVMISLEDYEALNETAYLLHSSKNTSRLLESIEELESGKGKERELIK